jgi:hypothetical protein
MTDAVVGVYTELRAGARAGIRATFAWIVLSPLGGWTEP